MDAEKINSLLPILTPVFSVLTFIAGALFNHFLNIKRLERLEKRREIKGLLEEIKEYLYEIHAEAIEFHEKIVSCVDKDHKNSTTYKTQKITFKLQNLEDSINLFCKLIKQKKKIQMHKAHIRQNIISLRQSITLHNFPPDPESEAPDTDQIISRINTATSEMKNNLEDVYYEKVWK